MILAGKDFKVFRPLSVSLTGSVAARLVPPLSLCLPYSLGHFISVHAYATGERLGQSIIEGGEV